MKSSYHATRTLMHAKWDMGVCVREYCTQSTNKEKYNEVVECRGGGLRDGVWCLGYLVGE